uniref:START domain-containing protein n=1 Tax=Compsopogon caeruleus TaxID=31354 RepID=A0A7S1TD13_9RHOD|mmetsp:Transcript_18256/g.38124  ORF Transcript_18256/g.38124 Transcript_18256/m.38124 type:complete len:267 (+) Transcript_18256:153-953(+)
MSKVHAQLMDEIHEELQQVMREKEPSGGGWDHMFASRGIDEHLGSSSVSGEQIALTFWRRAVSGSKGVFEYVALGVAPFSSTLLHNVIRDLDRRKEWDPHCASVTWLQRSETTKDDDIIHMEIAYPFPLANRDYVFARKTRAIVHDTGIMSYLTLCETVERPEKPEKRSIVRVVDFYQHFYIEPRNDRGCWFVIKTRDDPRGHIPKSVVNWAICKALPALADSLNDRCRACENLYGTEHVHTDGNTSPTLRPERRHTRKRSRLIVI